LGHLKLRAKRLSELGGSPRRHRADRRFLDEHSTLATLYAVGSESQSIR
jgi:hypothetical protein